MSRSIDQVKRLVVKIGSLLLVEPDSGRLRNEWLDALAVDVARCRSRGQDVVIVSSGAIALGRGLIGLGKGPLRLEDSQAAAAAGQIRLAHAYQEALAKHDVSVAQILLTIGDTEERRRYLNARSTINRLLQHGAVPVINENDTVATTEIRFGDNDRLAARVAQMVDADCLVLLSDIDGLYSADPDTNADAKLIPEVSEITAEVEAVAGELRPGYSSGGMVTKLQAAKVALGAGCHMIIADGKPASPLSEIEGGAACTWFVASSTPRTARKQWIAGTLTPAGVLNIDAGAARALTAGKSLLPAGVRSVDGTFDRGDAVAVRDVEGREVARGLCAYSAEDSRRIMGHKSGEIETLLGYRGRDEMIHRDDLVLL